MGISLHFVHDRSSDRSRVKGNITEANILCSRSYSHIRARFLIYDELFEPSFLDDRVITVMFVFWIWGFCLSNGPTMCNNWTHVCGAVLLLFVRGFLTRKNVVSISGQDRGRKRKKLHAPIELRKKRTSRVSSGDLLQNSKGQFLWGAKARYTLLFSSAIEQRLRFFSAEGQRASKLNSICINDFWAPSMGTECEIERG